MPSGLHVYLLTECEDGAFRCRARMGRWAVGNCRCSRAAIHQNAASPPDGQQHRTGQSRLQCGRLRALSGARPDLVIQLDAQPHAQRRPQPRRRRHGSSGLGPGRVVSGALAQKLIGPTSGGGLGQTSLIIDMSSS